MPTLKLTADYWHRTHLVGRAGDIVTVNEFHSERIQRLRMGKRIYGKASRDNSEGTKATRQEVKAGS